MYFYSRIIFLLIFFAGIQLNGFSQELLNKRSTLYVLTGTSGAKLNQFNTLLDDRGLSGLKNRYQSFGIGYQTRVNDFVMGLELYQNRGRRSEFDDFQIQYRTSRVLLNVGYAFTEESNFQLIHYMSLGLGYLNFQMLPKSAPSELKPFLSDPAQGFILRENDIQKGSSQFGGFLTEIGFHLSYDLDIPGRNEAVSLIGKFGYSFSPFEDKWQLNGLNFENTQSGAFLRVGAGISIPDRNYFYKDASIGIYVLRGFHSTKPGKFNQELEAAGLAPLSGKPSNLGLRILGESSSWLYGMEVYNLAMDGAASNFQSHSLNSLRVYGNLGRKFLQYENLGLGVLAGLGYGNIRYTLTQNSKPDFPELFEERKFDGYLKNGGLMAKPEIFIEYGIPVSKGKLFDLVLSSSFGYEVALANYRLAELSMTSFMSGTYWNIAIGIRP